MIERLRFVQQSPAARRPAAPCASPHSRSRRLTDLPEGPLGEALARLYQGLKSRR